MLCTTNDYSTKKGRKPKQATKLTKEQLEDLEEAQALSLTVKESVTLRFPDLHGEEWELRFEMGEVRVYEPRLEPLSPGFWECNQ
jgi:hypothetical protein